ncbi:tRNA (adenine(58)-N(1))-methyltransferase, mitochondrial [Eucyclogobius newberryi]|uniref:tRNA (adenine(58)-N(1))-methyltransferase, mitochondrial n=1 Tax=Eucyclogobius newberryi TaxID=166745 RepID=UPI003B596623
MIVLKPDKRQVVMAVKMSLKALSMQRFLRVCTSGHRGSIKMFLNVDNEMQKGKFLSTGYVMYAENDDTNSPMSNLKLNLRQALLLKRRRSLSPLERISSLLPQESLTPEVEELRGQDQNQLKSSSLLDFTVPHSVKEKHGYPGNDEGDEMEMSDELSAHASTGEKDLTEESLTSGPLHPPCLKGETRLTFGEFLVAEKRKKGQIEFRKMFRLQPGTRLQSSVGVIPHEEMDGIPAGSFLKTNRGVSIFIRRASLEDYVLFMRRGPAISYPKESAAMLMMMDVTEGDCVLEAGAGSGAMSLFLSRAVGASGKVVSVDVREDHLKRAVLNYNHWRTSWELRRGKTWPDNVEFVHADLCTTPALEGWGFHAVALDLIHPQLVLPVVIPQLHSGAVCAVYLANITQVIDLLEGLRCLRIPLQCERIMELPVRDWIVAPALQKDGTYCIRKSPTSEENSEKDGALKQDISEQDAAFGSIPYIARPHPEQLSHTAFLVKLRKHVQKPF